VTSATPTGLAAAVAGLDGVFHIGPAFAPNEAELGVAMVDAARAAGVRKFVFSGVIHPSISAMVNYRAKVPVEEALYTSGMDFTVLQPAVFMQNMERTWDVIVAHGRLAMPYSASSKMCWVDYRDVAEVAAVAMTGDELGYGTFELCAPGLLDRTEVGAICSDVLGRSWPPKHPSTSSRRNWPQGPVRDAMMPMMAHYDRCGFAGGNALVLRSMLGREPRSLANYFSELAWR
jgi:uncharacterized protein YbjT (DUF2867 family)